MPRGKITRGRSVGQRRPSGKTVRCAICAARVERRAKSRGSWAAAALCAQLFDMRYSLEGGGRRRRCEGCRLPGRGDIIAISGKSLSASAVSSEESGNVKISAERIPVAAERRLDISFSVAAAERGAPAATERVPPGTRRSFRAHFSTHSLTTADHRHQRRRRCRRLELGGRRAGAAEQPCEISGGSAFSCPRRSTTTIQKAISPTPTC
jgi:hypothetical protein